MSQEEIKQKVCDYLASHRLMALATITPDGRPLIHAVEYVSEGATLFFGTLRTTRKIHNILKNPIVAYAVNEDYGDWLKIQGVQMEGKAEILTEEKDIRDVSMAYMKKFPFAGSLPPNPDFVFVKIEPTGGFFLDYTKGFTHRDEVTY